MVSPSLIKFEKKLQEALPLTSTSLMAMNREKDSNSVLLKTCKEEITTLHTNALIITQQTEAILQTLNAQEKIINTELEKIFNSGKKASDPSLQSLIQEGSRALDTAKAHLNTLHNKYTTIIASADKISGTTRQIR